MSALEAFGANIARTSDYTYTPEFSIVSPHIGNAQLFTNVETVETVETVYLICNYLNMHRCHLSPMSGPHKYVNLKIFLENCRLQL